MTKARGLQKKKNSLDGLEPEKANQKNYSAAICPKTEN